MPSVPSEIDEWLTKMKVIVMYIMALQGVDELHEQLGIKRIVLRFSEHADTWIRTMDIVRNVITEWERVELWAGRAPMLGRAHKRLEERGEKFRLYVLLSTLLV